MIPRVIESIETAPDEPGACIVHLECGHRRHVRHRPPLTNAPWVADPSTWYSKRGETIECLRCARLERPDSFVEYKTTPTFDRDSLPRGLQSRHKVKAGAWGELRVLEGSVRLRFFSPLDHVAELTAPASISIPPQIEHQVELEGPCSVQVAFHRAPDPGEA